MKTIRVVWPAIALAGLTAALLTGCGGGDALITQSTASGHVLMSDARHVEAVPGQTVDGTLALVGPCFGLATSAGTFAAVFPNGSKLIENTDQVEIPGWGTLGLGNHYQGGGGAVATATLSYHNSIPAGCGADHIIVLDPIR
ncbi:MAG TPA: hypothetical protein PJ998_09345 [Terrimesophilobacter sp.]|nr:hypothetical protein [Terrimesophilobacter sp.]